MDWSSETGQSLSPPADDAAPDLADGAGSLGWKIVTQEVVAILSRKWVIPVVRALASGAKRRFQLAQSIKGVTPKVLTETLRLLERDGVIDRVLYDDRRGSKSVAYQLTDLGRTLWAPIEELHRWGREHLDEVHSARQQHDDIQINFQVEIPHV
jgi:DNA-binding HxlR family transcriptional regulator